MLELLEAGVDLADCSDWSRDEVHSEDDGENGQARTVHPEHKECLRDGTGGTLGKSPSLSFNRLHVSQCSCFRASVDFDNDVGNVLLVGVGLFDGYFSLRLLDVVQVEGPLELRVLFLHI